MLQLSLRRLLFLFTLCACFMAIFGLFVNQIRLVQELFSSGDRKILIESSPVNLRGTYFEIYCGKERVIDRQMLSVRRLKASEIDVHEIDPDGDLVACYYENPKPEVMDVLLLVDFKAQAYAVYWAGCRAEKCEKLDWNVWDERCTNFNRYLDQLPE